MPGMIYTHNKKAFTMFFESTVKKWLMHHRKQEMDPCGETSQKKTDGLQSTTPQLRYIRHETGGNKTLTAAYFCLQCVCSEHPNDLHHFRWKTLCKLRYYHCCLTPSVLTLSFTFSFRENTPDNTFIRTIPGNEKRTQCFTVGRCSRQTC